MDKKQTEILDSILRQMSQNFQRACLKPGPSYAERERIDDAIENLRYDLNNVIDGFDEMVNQFVNGLQTDLAYSAPELAFQKLLGRFMAFRDDLIKYAATRVPIYNPTEEEE